MKHEHAGNFIVRGVDQRATLGGVESISTESKNKPIIPKLHPTNETPAGEWNAYDIICKDNTIEIKVNGLVHFLSLATGSLTRAITTSGMTVSSRIVLMAMILLPNVAILNFIDALAEEMEAPDSECTAAPTAPGIRMISERPLTGTIGICLNLDALMQDTAVIRKCARISISQHKVGEKVIGKMAGISCPMHQIVIA